MVTITRDTNLPNVLIVDGIDPNTEYRPALRTALYDAGSASPVRRGTHDFWICFPYPPQPEFNPTSANFAYGDDDARSAGRVLRGMGDMRRMPQSPSAAEVQGRLFTLLHETAHAWLVPADMRIRTTSGEVTPLTAAELTTMLNQERPLTRPALLARQDLHWSCYVNFCSCMDSVKWDRTPGQGGTMKWVQRSPAATAVRPTNLVAVETNAVYSDLDLYIMGAKRADQCFPETGGQFFWLDPKLSLGAPMQYHAGLFVAFSPTDYIYFGFYNDHGKLRVERSSTGERSAIIDIGPAYQPLRQEYEAMMLRVVKRGGRYLFQACRGNNALAVLAGTGPFMFDGSDAADSAPTVGDYSRWQTVASFNVAGATAQAIGVITKTWNPILLEAKFFTFDIRQGTTNNALRLYDVSPTATRPTLASLPNDLLVADTPQSGALFRRRNFMMIMGVPYSDAYDHWSAVDKAPKMMTRAPAGDFSFGVTLKVHRSLVSPWAGGAAVGMTMWGIEGAANVRDVIVPERIRRNWAPPPTSYKNAFIVVTNRRSNIRGTDLMTLDVLRRYYDSALGAVSRGLLTSDSHL